ncbi:uncharacterized protein [Dermacentor andersoni]|uniref:uncharacterized protein n=1 Tax=Dermacentor andersoni TaxID=34620 RepID=UPI0024163025|nr:uncharacterized protein LOC126543448 [Dermacentor andersoni]
MQADGDQVDAVVEDDAPIQAKSMSRTQAGETNEISQQLDSPAQPDSERSQRNTNQGPLRSPPNTSSSGNQEQTSDTARGRSENVHEQSLGVASNEHGATPEPLPSFSDAVESPSRQASQVTQPSYEDSTALPAANAAANAAVHTSSILPALEQVRSAYRFPLQGPDSSRERNVSGAYEAPDDGALSPQPATEVDASDATENARRRVVRPSLERLVGAHTRRMRLGQQYEASIRVRVPPDLEVLEQGPCRFTLILANDEAGVPEGTHHLAEWETFTRALLAVHVCIHRVTVLISAVSRSPRNFYRGFSLRDGTAVIFVEVSAFRDPCIEFVLPYLRNLCRLGMAEEAGICFQDMVLLNRDVRGQEMFRELLQMDDRLELDNNNRNLVRILDTTREMPFLRQLVIYLHNTGSGPSEPRQISLNLTLHFSTDARRLRYEVDATYAPFLRCQCANDRGVSTTTGVETSIIPTLSARRELTCSTGDLVPYIVSVTHPAMHGTYVIHVLSIVWMRAGD